LDSAVIFPGASPITTSCFSEALSKIDAAAFASSIDNAAESYKILCVCCFCHNRDFVEKFVAS
jgi:cytochrome c553